MKKQIIDRIVKCAIWTAVIYLVTWITGSAFPLPSNAYIHLGDAVICLAALALPMHFALIAATVGSALADITFGAYGYIIATILIKALIVVAAKLMLRLSDKPLTQDSLICALSLISVAGYFFTELVLGLFAKLGFIASLTAAADGVYANLLQALASAVVYLAASAPLRKSINKKTEDSDLQ